MKASWHWQFPRAIVLIFIGYAIVLSPLWADENGRGSEPHPLKPKISRKSLEAPKGVIEALSSVIEQVQATDVGQQVQVRVTGSGTLSCAPFRLGNPDRLVLDCAGARVQVRPSVTVVDLNPVHSVRVGQFKSDVARIVIDLREVSPYTLRTDGNSITVSFEAADPPTSVPSRDADPRVLNAASKTMSSGNPPQVPVDAPPGGRPDIPSPRILGGTVPSTGQLVNPGSGLLKPTMDSAAPREASV